MSGPEVNPGSGPDGPDGRDDKIGEAAEEKAVTLGAGHRRAKPAKGRKSEAARAPKSKKLRTPDAGRGKLSKLVAPLVALVAALVRLGKAIPPAIARFVNRTYDAAVADPVRATKVLAAVVAGVALLGGVFWFVTDRYARTAVARVEASDAGQRAVISLLSYNFRSIDRQAEKTEDIRTGKFKDEYAQFINTTVAPSAKDKQIAVQTAVDEVSVTDSSPSEVGLLLYIEQQSDSKLSVDGSTSSSAVKVTLEKEDGKWKVSELTPV